MEALALLAQPQIPEPHPPGEPKRDSRPGYTPENDQLIVSRMTAAEAAGTDKEAALMAVADELGRTLGGIRVRWGRLKREMNQESGGGDEALALIKKLRQQKDERADLLRQRDGYKMAAEKAQNELSRMEKDHHALKKKYEALVAELTAAVMGDE